MAATETRCPACMSVQADFDRMIYEYELLVCRHCGLAFAWPRPTPEVVDQFYHSLNLSEDFYGGQSPFKMAFFEACHSKIRRYVREGKMLDFGCGDGAFLSAEPTGEFALFGSDLNEGARSAVAEKKVEFLIGPIAKQQIADNSIDVIFTSATYEHLLDPVEITKEFHRILRPGGILFIVSVPNYDAFNIRFNFEDWLINRPPAHINFFTLSALSRMLENNGFSVTERWTYGFNLDPIKRRMQQTQDDKVQLEEIVGKTDFYYGADHTVTSGPPRVSTFHRWVAQIYFAKVYFGFGDKLAIIAVKSG